MSGTKSNHSKMMWNLFSSKYRKTQQHLCEVWETRNLNVFPGLVTWTRNSLKKCEELTRKSIEQKTLWDTFDIIVIWLTNCHIKLSCNVGTLWHFIFLKLTFWFITVNSTLGKILWQGTDHIYVHIYALYILHVYIFPSSETF